MPDIDFQKIVLNLIPKKEDEPVVFYASQYETARPFIADLMWGESEFAPGDSCWAEIDIRKVDDNLVVITDDVTIDNNEVSVVLPVQALTCVGKNFGQVKIYADVDTLVCALNFILEVQPDPLAGGVTSETAIDNLATQIDEIAQAEGYLKAEDVAPVALSGSYNDLTDKPTIPDKLNDLSDVDADPPLANDYSLFYNYSQQKWKAMPGATYVYVNDKFYRKTQVDNLLEAMLPNATASGAVASVNVAMEGDVTYTADASATKIMKTSGSAELSNDIKGIYSGTYKFVDLGSLTWVKIGMGGSRQGFRASNISDMELTPAANVKINAICSGYDIDTGNNVYSGNTGLAGWGVSTRDIAIYDPELEAGDAVAFKKAMDGIYFIYKLDSTITPTITDSDFATLCTSFNINGEIYTLSENIETSIGENNFFGDVGDISVSAKDTIQHYIDERT